LLAYAERETLENYLAKHAIEQRTPNTLVARQAFDAEIARIRETEYCATFSIALSAPVARFNAAFDDYLSILRRVARSAKVLPTHD
jgi:hypothetical protein